MTSIDNTHAQCDSVRLSRMKNYRILERLGKGGQGSVYLAEHKLDGQKYVLKKVECHDESEANKAFKEALALQKLQHPYVCGYKEFFVTWDKEESSMFVCIVMTLYNKGDLKKIITQYQTDKTPISEELIKKYLGEILEALIFVHKKGVIHRDLKPSNIFLQDDDSICLGDFGVATIMGDAKTNTRNTVGTTNYMAPEVQDNPYDERSDVWALGCILFELVTTPILDGPGVAEKLAEIKDDPGVLELIFEDVAKHFSGEIITAIRLMLKYNPNRRPSAEQLVEKSEYIKKCLEMSDSSLRERRKRQGQAEDSTDFLSCESPGVLVVLEHIAKNIDSEKCVKVGLEHLVEITKQDGVLLDTNSKRLVAAAMKDNIGNKAIQIAGCNVLNNIIVSAQAGDVLFSTDIISAVVQTMKAHPGCVELQQTAASLLMALAADNQAVETMGAQGGIEQVLKAMRSHIANPELVATCCSALWSLSVSENNSAAVYEGGAVEAVCTGLTTHIDSPEVAEAACAALFSLSLDDKSFDFVNDLDTVGLLLIAMETHNKNAKVVKNACMALAGLVEPDEECAYRVLTSESQNRELRSTEGIPIMMRAYDLHKDNAEVVESVVTLVMELANYDEICRDLLSYKLPALIKEIQLKFNKNEGSKLDNVDTDDIRAEMTHLWLGNALLLPVHKRFRDNRDIMKPCEAAMQKLNIAKPSI